MVSVAITTPFVFTSVTVVFEDLVTRSTDVFLLIVLGTDMPVQVFLQAIGLAASLALEGFGCLQREGQKNTTLPLASAFNFI